MQFESASVALRAGALSGAASIRLFLASLMMTHRALQAVGRMFVPRSRALVNDVLWLHRQVPTCSHTREMQLLELSDLRRQLGERVSWATLFVLAFARVSTRYPQLLQTWRVWPFAHLFQHAAPVASIAVQRHYQNDDWLLWGKIQSPHEKSLSELQSLLDRFTNGPVEEVFRQQLQLAMLPTPLRRFVWWCNLNFCGEKRVKRTGTFLLTTLAGRGADNAHPPSFLTSSLSYAPLQADGQCRVSLIYDHRLMDGALIADCLAELEEELNGAVLAELRELASTNCPRAAA